MVNSPFPPLIFCQLLDADLFMIWGFPWTGNPQFLRGLEWKQIAMKMDENWGCPHLRKHLYGLESPKRKGCDWWLMMPKQKGHGNRKGLDTWWLKRKTWVDLEWEMILDLTVCMTHSAGFDQECTSIFIFRVLAWWLRHAAECHVHEPCGAGLVFCLWSRRRIHFQGCGCWDSDPDLCNLISKRWIHAEQCFFEIGSRRDRWCHERCTWSNLINFDHNHGFHQVWSNLINFDQI